MADCPYGYNGTATVERTPDGPRWTRTDCAIHVADELVTEPFLLDRYEIVGPCEAYEHLAIHHARRRDDG